MNSRSTPDAPALRVVVADDEPATAEALARELRRLGCDVAAVTSSGDPAVAACAATQPNACFVDVSTPGIDGPAVARALREATPGVRVVLVSAHPRFAVEAYGGDVVDFLLKPLNRAHVADAVDRVQRSRLTGDAGDRLLIPERGTIHLLPIGDIEWVQADSYYLWLHTSARAWMLRERMHRIDERLRSAGFLRVHRSAMVRLSHITALDGTAGSEPRVVLRSGARVRIARNRIATIRSLLHPRPVAV